MSSASLFKERFNLSVPLILGPMGGISDPGLCAQVANAGGMALMPIWPDPLERAQTFVRETQALTKGTIGVNLRADLVQVDHVRLALDEGVNLIHLFWGDPRPTIDQINGDFDLICTVSDEATIQQALEAGATALIAQGTEAGGHVASDIALEQLLDITLSHAGDIPVLAAGGIVTRADAEHALSRGAAGVLIGSRFVSATESVAHPDYKQAILEAGEKSTVRTLCFDGLWPDAPHRVLNNETVAAWQANGSPAADRPGEGDVILQFHGVDIERYSALTPRDGMTGDILNAALYAGTGVSRIERPQSATEIVAEFADL